MVKKEHLPTKDHSITRLATVNLHKRLYGVSHTKKAVRAVKAVREFAKKLTGTKDVRIDVNLNRQLWAKGIRHPPSRIRVRMITRLSADEVSKEEYYTVVSHVPTTTYKGLQNETVIDTMVY